MGRQRVEPLFDAVPEAVVVVEFIDGEPIVRNVNDTFERRFGYDADTLRGRSLNDYIVPDDDQQVAAEIDAAAAAGNTVEREVTRLAADGTRDFLLRVAPFEEQETVKSVGIYIDVTDRGRERQRYETLIEHSSDIITILDTDGTIRYQSPSIERVLGYEPDELVGDNAFDYVHPEDRQEVMEEFQAGVTNPTANPRVEYRFRAADGSWRTLESIGSNHIDRPPIEGYVVNSRDVTERKEREEQLEWYRAYVKYQEKQRELSEIRVELNVLETETEGEVRDSERYDRLTARIAELEEELDAIEAEFEDIPEGESVDI